MGGEPTFVSIDDMDGEEWNTAALGPAKLKRAKELLLRLRDEFGKGGLLHYGQGKWYPGEPLPRWTLTYFWRTDGVALWNDSRWLAETDRDYGFGTNAARQFTEALSQRLGVGADYVIITIMVGGFKHYESDGAIPVKYGVTPTVGDTIGPGAVFRLIRTAPVVQEVVRNIHATAPKAWLSARPDAMPRSTTTGGDGRRSPFNTVTAFLIACGEGSLVRSMTLWIGSTRPMRKMAAVAFSNSSTGPSSDPVAPAPLTSRGKRYN